VTPERAIVAPANARAIPARKARPTLASRAGARERPALAVQGAEAGARPGGREEGSRPAPVERATPGERAAPGESSEPVRARGTAVRAIGQPGTQPGAEGAPVGAPPVQRPLYNRAVPPPPRANFEQQRQAIESTDPGRPLSPVQMDNLRQNRPVGPAQVREIPHPAPVQAPRFEPPSRPEPAPRFEPAPRPAPASRSARRPCRSIRGAVYLKC
jgi:hypothetical protein